MEDIIENIENVTVSEKVRTFRCEIDTPENKDRLVTFHSERTIRNNGVTVAKNPEESIIRQFSSVATEFITTVDPVTQQQITQSVANVALAIQNRYILWYAENKLNKVLDEIMMTNKMVELNQQEIANLEAILVSYNDELIIAQNASPYSQEHVDALTLSISEFENQKALLQNNLIANQNLLAQLNIKESEIRQQFDGVLP